MYLRTMTQAGPTKPVAYTCPAGKVALVKSIHLSNTLSSPVEATVQVGDFFLIRSGVIPSGASLNAIDGVVVLQPGDELRVFTPGGDGDVHAIVSLMEVSQ